MAKTFRSARILLIAALASMVAWPAAVTVADEGDPAGWSVSVDPRGRAFLEWVSEAGGPRVLLLGCLRDAEEFFVSAKNLPGMEEGDDIELQLIVADAEWRITGAVTRTDDELLTFEKEMELGAKAAKSLGRELMPVLTAPGPIVLQVGNSETMDLPLEPIPPRAGIEEAAAKFAKVCFGGK